MNFRVVYIKNISVRWEKLISNNKSDFIYLIAMIELVFKSLNNAILRIQNGIFHKFWTMFSIEIYVLLGYNTCWFDDLYLDYKIDNENGVTSGWWLRYLRIKSVSLMIEDIS